MGEFFNSQFIAHKYTRELKGLLKSGKFFSFTSHYLPMFHVNWITCRFHLKVYFLCRICFSPYGDLISQAGENLLHSPRPAEIPFLITEARNYLFLPKIS